MKILKIGTVLLFTTILITGCGLSTTPEKPSYSEETYTLEDGTPCVIIRGGTHSNMVGVTCNYDIIKERR